MKLTRKSYKRKIIAFGIASFISLSLIATGFAAWVLAGSAEREDNGQITVGTTTEKAIEISALEFTDDIKNFVFEPEETDTTGRVRYDGENSVNLSISFTCSITAASFVKDIYVTFTMPTGVQDAVDAGYIVAPVVDIHINATSTSGSQTAKLGLSNGETEGGGEWTYTPQAGDTATLTVTLNFAWGDEFGGQNPGEYLDSPEGRDNYPTTPEVKAVLDQFKATLLGVDYAEYLALLEAASLDDAEAIATLAGYEADLKYTIYINAEA